MIGAWDAAYRDLTEPHPYGTDDTYKMAADFLADCETVEDWGCGMGWFKLFRPDCIGVDGSCSPFADKIADLAEYVSSCDGILLRHVIDHNFDWPKIVRNAIASARRRIVVVLFLRPVAQTMVTRVDQDTFPGVPDIAFNLWDIIDLFPVTWMASWTTVESETVITAEVP